MTSIDTAAQNVQPQLNTQTAAANTEPEGSSPGVVAPASVPVPTPKGQSAAETKAALPPPAAAPDTQAALSAAATGEALLPVASQAAAAPTVEDKASATPSSPPPVVLIKPTDPAAAETQVAAAVPLAAEPVQKPKVQELTASPQVLETAPQTTPQKKPRKTLFATMFGDSQQKAASPTAAQIVEPKTTELALAAPQSGSKAARAAIAEAETPQLKLTEASLADSGNEAPAGPSVDNGDLPGVRKGALFEIKRRDSLDSDADIDIGETDGGPVLLASAGGFARLAPNGLKVQRQSVDVACLKPQLVRMLKKIESHYGQSVVVTSGYRSPSYNRRVRGAKNSLHMFCAAADIQVAGVGKWELAKYMRSMAGRGGVGTYCHTNSVHVDIGPDRDWNWRCSRRR
ncbi:MAG: D-Ala-D-Ala carboxypeptidase family metallohydrolase [Rhizobiaceae bacterium]